MNSLEEQYGFDAIFVAEVPDYMKCIVCHLVLRQPVQIMKCGHRFCKPCYERILTYSKHMGTEFSCPIDREAVDVNKVFDDNGICRVIQNLRVKCSNNETGCIWIGDLRDVKTHEEQCQHAEIMVQHDHPKIQELENETIISLVKELSTRLEKCEDAIDEKDKDVASLKLNILELKKNAKEKDKEFAALQAKNINIENEMKLMNEKMQESKKLFEREIEVLTLKNQLLVNKLEKLLGERKEVAVNSEVGELKNTNCLQKEIECAISNFKHGLHTESEQSLTPLTNLQNEVEKTKEEMKEIVSHVENIENIMFCHHFDNKTNVKITWILHNYEYYRNVGEFVYSPVFYTQVRGYRFQLHVSWAGEKKDALGMFLHIHRGNNYDNNVEPFRMQYTFEIYDKHGNKCCYTIRPSHIDENRDVSFTIHGNDNTSRKGFGPPRMLTMPSLQNFIINDRLTMYCILERE